MTFCTPCHNNAMSNNLKVQTECEGGKTCPLGIPSHPKANTDGSKSCFPMGCSLCRSEKLALIANNEKGSAGISLEKRGDMIQRFGGVLVRVGLSE